MNSIEFLSGEIIELERRAIELRRKRLALAERLAVESAGQSIVDELGALQRNIKLARSGLIAKPNNAQFISDLQRNVERKDNLLFNHATGGALKAMKALDNE